MSIARRIFLQRSATAATPAALPAVPASAGEQTTGETLHFSRAADRIRVQGGNGIAVACVLEGKWLRGIGAVSLRGKALRDASEFIRPRIATPYGMEVCAFELADVREDAGAVVITTRPWYRLTHRLEWTEHAMHGLVNTATTAPNIPSIRSRTKPPGNWVGTSQGMDS